MYDLRKHFQLSHKSCSKLQTKLQHGCPNFCPHWNEHYDHYDHLHHQLQHLCSRNMLVPIGVTSQRQRAKFIVRIYRADGLPR